MPAANSFTVYDRKPTPVAHTFVPRFIEPGKAVFAKPGSVPGGDEVVTSSWRTSGDGKRLIRRVTVRLPVMVNETINGVTRATYERHVFCDLSFSFSNESTEQERADAVEILANLLNEGLDIGDAIVGNEGHW